MLFSRKVFSTAIAATIVMVTSMPAMGCELDENCTLKKEAPVLGLALSGGGVRGSAHIGVLRVLESEKIPVKVIAGTSMGAIIGGLFSAGVPLDLIETEVRKNISSAITSSPPAFAVAAQALREASHIQGLPGLYESKRMASRMERVIPLDRRNIEDLPIKFGAVAVDMLSGRDELISSGELIPALRASSAIPFVFKPVRIGNKLYSDGGLMNNLPVEEAKGLGADIVIAVDIDEDPQLIPESALATYQGFGSRTIGLNLWKIDELQRKRADILIQPGISRIQYSSLREEDVVVAIKAGEEAARAALPEIRRRLNAARCPHQTVPTDSMASDLQPVVRSDAQINRTGAAMLRQ